MRRRNSSTDGCGNLGAPPQPPHSASNWRAQVPRRLPQQALRQRIGRRRDLPAARPRRAQTPASRRLRAARDTRPRPRQQLREARQPVSRLGRVVRPAEERLAGGRQEDGHRPAAVPGQRDDGVHVERVDVGPLLAVHLDVHEALVHERGRLVVLERLVLHDMAPVAGRVADGEEDRLVLGAGLRERVLAPRVPVDRVVSMLEQVGTGFVREPVHAHTLPPHERRWPPLATRLATSPEERDAYSGRLVNDRVGFLLLQNNERV